MTKAIKPMADEIETYSKTLGDGTAKISGIPSGFNEFDNKISGFRDLVVVGGAPKTGKTTFILQASVHAAREGYPVLIYSLEMTRREIYTKVLSYFSQIPYQDILIHGRPVLDKTYKPNDGFHPFFKDTENEVLVDAFGRMGIMNNFYIVDFTDERFISYETLEEDIKALQASYNTKKILVVVDHLQIFPQDGTGYKETLGRDIESILNFNRIQKTTGCTMILISQLKKDGMRQSVPSSNNDIMAAFNGTIYIPYLANQILGMYRKGEIVKISIINRDNADETISLHLNGAISTFTEDKWDKGGWENEEGGEDELN